VTSADPPQHSKRPEAEQGRVTPPRLPSQALRQRALAAATHPSVPRGVLVRQTVSLTLGSWALAIVVFAYAGGLRIQGRPVALVAGTSAGMLIIAALSAWAALGRGRSTLGRARHWLIPVIIGAPLVILAWKVFWSAQYEGALEQWPTRPGFRCLVLSLSIAICPLIAFAVSRRGTDPRQPMLTGFAAGVAIGAVTSLLTDLWCPVAYVPHLLLGHLLPIALLGAMGAWLGRQIIALRGDD
jgi:hypothetical protein